MATTSGREAGLRLRGFSGKWLEERPGLQRMEFTGNWYYVSPILTHHSDRSFCQFLKFIGHMPQLDTQDRERDNHQRAGPENLPPAHRDLRPGGSNLSGNVVDLR